MKEEKKKNKEKKKEKLKEKERKKKGRKKERKKERKEEHKHMIKYISTQFPMTEIVANYPSDMSAFCRCSLCLVIFFVRVRCIRNADLSFSVCHHRALMTRGRQTDQRYTLCKYRITQIS